MNTRTYIIHEDSGDTIEIRFDPSQASSPITYRHPTDRQMNLDTWLNTPFQCADARHDPERAANLIEDWFASEGDGAGVVSWVEEVAA